MQWTDNYSLCYVGETSHEIIKSINSSLSEERSRLNGLNLIVNTIDHLSTEDLTECLPRWLQIFQNILENGNSNVKALCCNVYSLLFITMKEVTTFMHSFGTNHINQLITVLINANDLWCVPALKCMECILKLFSGPSFTMKNQIEKFLYSCIALESQPIVTAAAECLPWLCVSGGGGIKKANHKSFWESVCNSIITSLHMCLNELSEDWASTSGYSSVRNVKGGDLLPLPCITLENDEERKKKFVSRFIALSECLKQMIGTSLSLLVTIPYHDILILINRGAKICHFIFENFTHNKTLFCLIPKILSASLEQLKSLILCMKKEAILQGGLFCKFFISCLQMTHLQNEDKVVNLFSHLFCHTRIQIYSVLKCWILISGSSSGCHNVAKYIIQEILADIQIKEDVVKLQSARSSKIGGKRKRKSYLPANGAESSTKRALCFNFKSELCASALEVLEVIICSIGNIISNEDIQKVYHETMDIILKCQDQDSFPVPYDVSKCRRMVYSLLSAFVISCKTHHHLISTSAALVMFQNGLQDSDYEICYACQKSLIICNPIIHPRAPTLDIKFPLPLANKDQTSPLSVPSTSVLNKIQLEPHTAGFTSLFPDHQKADLKAPEEYLGDHEVTNAVHECTDSQVDLKTSKFNDIEYGNEEESDIEEDEDLPSTEKWPRLVEVNDKLCEANNQRSGDENYTKFVHYDAKNCSSCDGEDELTVEDNGIHNEHHQDDNAINNHESDYLKINANHSSENLKETNFVDSYDSSSGIENNQRKMSRKDKDGSDCAVEELMSAFVDSSPDMD